MILKLIKKMLRNVHNNPRSRPWFTPSTEGKKKEDKAPVNSDLDVNLTYLQETLGYSADLVIRQFTISSGQPVSAALVFIDGLVDSVTINETIMKSLMLEMRMVGDDFPAKEIFRGVKNRVLSVGQLREVHNLSDLLDGMLSGDTVLLIDGNSTALLLGTRGGNPGQ